MASVPPPVQRFFPRPQAHLQTASKLNKTSGNATFKHHENVPLLSPEDSPHGTFSTYSPPFAEFYFDAVCVRPMFQRSRWNGRPIRRQTGPRSQSWGRKLSSAVRKAGSFEGTLPRCFFTQSAGMRSDLKRSSDCRNTARMIQQQVCRMQGGHSGRSISRVMPEVRLPENRKLKQRGEESWKL